jgi:hypothetical protein
MSIHYLSRDRVVSDRKAGFQGVGNENADAQYDDNSSDSSKHKPTTSRCPRLCQKNIPEGLTLRMLYMAFSHERREDIGRFG